MSSPVIGVRRMSERSALLVDFGGVLTTSVDDAFRDFSSQISDDPELVLRLLSWDAGSSMLLVEDECGRLDDESFEHGFAARLAAHGVRVPRARLAEAVEPRYGRRSADAGRARRAAGRWRARLGLSPGREGTLSRAQPASMLARC
jgi:hypothetical protein